MEALVGTGERIEDARDDRSARKDDKKIIKCVVWDLDHTIWDGVLLEDRGVTLWHHVVDVIKVLDERGILHSIASRNDHDTAMSKLRDLGLDDRRRRRT